MNIFKYVIDHENVEYQQSGGEVLAAVVEMDPGLVRSYILEEKTKSNHQLIHMIQQQLLNPKNIARVTQYAEVII